MITSEKKDIEVLLRHPLVVGELQAKGARVSSRFGSLTPLDYAFVEGSSVTGNLRGTELFGLNEAVGIVSVRGTEGFRRAREKIASNPELGKQIRLGAQISLMSTGDAEKWAEFYDQVQEEDWRNRIGRRVDKYSGLRRTGTQEIEAIERAAANVLLSPKMQADLHKNFGVRAIHDKDDDRRLDIQFVNDRGEITPIPLRYIRRPEMNNSIVEAVVEPEISVPGFVLPSYGRNERESMARARKIARELGKNLEFDEVPIFDMRQARLSQKISPLSKLESQVQADIDLERLFYFLYFGDSYLSSGALSGYSLPGNASEMLGLAGDASRSVYGLDVVIMKKDASGGHRLAPLDEPIWGLSLRNSGPIFKPVDNVAAMVMVPETWGHDEIRRYVDEKSTVLRRHIVSSGYAEVLPVTKGLTDMWYQGGLYVPKEDRAIELRQDAKGDNSLSEDQGTESKEIAKAPMPEKQSSPGLRLPLRGRQDSGMYYVRWSMGPAVGGSETGIAFIDSNGDHKLVMTNMGHNYGIGSPSENGIGGKPPTHAGIYHELGNGQIPIIPGALALTEIYRTADFGAWQTNRDDIRGAFLRAELFRRGSLEHFIQVVTAAERLTPQQTERNIRLAAEMFSRGEQDAKRLYDEIDFSLIGALIPHAHYDHFPWFRVLGNGSAKSQLEGATLDNFLIGDELYMMAPLTHAFLLQKRDKGSSWKDDVVDYVHMALPRRGNEPYPRDPRNIAFFEHNGGIIRLPNGATVEGRITDHSIPHTVASLITHPRESARFLSVGDFRPGPLTDKMKQGFAGRADVIEVETTNPPDSHKPRKTEENLRMTFEKVCRTHSGLVVAAAPDNNPERIKILVEAAKEAGRKVVVVDPKIASGLEFIRYGIAQAAVSGDLFDSYRNFPTFPESVLLWDKPGERPKKYVKAIRDTARAHGWNVDSKDLSAIASEAVLIVSPYDSLTGALAQIDLPPDSAYFHSTFRPYSPIESANIAGRFDALRKMDFTVYSQFAVKGSGGGAYIIEGDQSITNHERLGITTDQFTTHISGHGFYPFVRDSVIELLDGKYKGKTVLLTHGERPNNYRTSLRNDLRLAEVDFKQRLGLDRPEQLKIVSQMKHYDPTKPLKEPYSHPVLYNAYTYKIG